MHSNHKSLKHKLIKAYGELVLIVKRNTHFMFIFSSDIYVLTINKCDVLFAGGQVFLF